MLSSRFSCVSTPNTQLKIAVDKYVLYQKANCYKGKELLIEEDEEAPPTKYVKVHPSKLSKHEPEVIKRKKKHTNMDLYAIIRFYRLKAHYPGLEPDEKPPVDGIDHQIGLLSDSEPHLLHSRDSFQHGLLMDQGVLCCLPGTCLLFCIFPTPDSSSLITLNPSLKMFILMLNLKLILMCLHLKHMILHLPGSTLAGLRLSYSEQGKNLLKLWKTDDMLRSKL